jgi:type II secretory pathway component PulC
MAVALPFTSPKTWLARINEQAPPLLSFSLALVCGYLLARLVWALVPVTPDSSPVMLNEATVELAPTQNAGEQIAQVHLFGEATQAPPTQAAPAPTTPPSNLKLIGVITGNPGFAIIENAGQQKAYRLNEKIENTNQSLASIDTRSVKLSMEGSKTLSELKMPDLAKANSAGMANAEMPQDMGVMPEEMPIEAEPVVVEEPPVIEQTPEIPPEQVPESVPSMPTPTNPAAQTPPAHPNTAPNTPDMILPPGSTQALPEVEQGIVPPTLEPDVVPPTAVEPPPTN